jgi:hypothetical protein
MGTLALQSPEFHVLPQDPVSSRTAETRQYVGTLLGNGIIEGFGLATNTIGRTIRFAGDLTVAGVKNLLRGFFRYPHS